MKDVAENFLASDLESIRDIVVNIAGEIGNTKGMREGVGSGNTIALVLNQIKELIPVEWFTRICAALRRL